MVGPCQSGDGARKVSERGQSERGTYFQQPQGWCLGPSAGRTRTPSGSPWRGGVRREKQERNTPSGGETILCQLVAASPPRAVWLARQGGASHRGPRCQRAEHRPNNLRSAGWPQDIAPVPRADLSTVGKVQPRRGQGHQLPTQRDHFERNSQIAGASTMGRAAPGGTREPENKRARQVVANVVASTSCASPKAPRGLGNHATTRAPRIRERAHAIKGNEKGPANECSTKSAPERWSTSPSATDASTI